MYDWANSAYITTVVTAVFPAYYQSVAATHLSPADATGRYAIATTCALLLVAVMAPFLGAVADLRPVKKRMLGAFLAIGILAAAAMTGIGSGDWALALVLFVLGNVGAFGSFIFYDALLPHVAKGDEIDRVSTAGYALGYVGGGLLLALNLLWIKQPGWFGLSGPEAAVRLSFASVAVWWALFSLPLLFRVPEPGGGNRTAPPKVTPAAVLKQLRGTMRELSRYKQALLFMGAFLVYNDGIVTIIRMATVYGAEIGIGSGEMIAAVLVVQFVGVPFAFLFGACAGWFGTRRMILLGLAVYCLITLVGYHMDSATDFFVLAGLVAMVQGGCQALSRSLFASMIPKHKSGEFFAFFAVLEKGASVLGPAVFAGVGIATGDSRAAVLAVATFFVIGGFILSRVNVEEGRAAARAAQL